VLNWRLNLYEVWGRRLRPVWPRSNWGLAVLTIIAGLVVILAVGVYFSGTGPAEKRPTTFGTVTGALEERAVPGPPGVTALPGTVTLTAAGGRRYTIHVRDNGAFSVHVPAGTYTADGSSPGLVEGATDAAVRCFDVSLVHVKVGSTTRIVVSCF